MCAIECSDRERCFLQRAPEISRVTEVGPRPASRVYLHNKLSRVHKGRICPSPTIRQVHCALMKIHGAASLNCQQTGHSVLRSDTRISLHSRHVHQDLDLEEKEGKQQKSPLDTFRLKLSESKFVFLKQSFKRDRSR